MIHTSDSARTCESLLGFGWYMAVLSNLTIFELFPCSPYLDLISWNQCFTLLVCGKTDTGYRDAHLSAEAYEKIQAWLAARPIKSPFIFTSFTTRASIPIEKAMSEVAVWKMVQRYAKACDLEHIKPHDFRRFLGTQLAATDIRDAQKALGHKSIEVTVGHYVLDTLKVGLTDNLY